MTFKVNESPVIKDKVSRTNELNSVIIPNETNEKVPVEGNCVKSLLDTQDSFDMMVGDMRRIFFDWLKTTESELNHQRFLLLEEKKEYQEERKRLYESFLSEKRLEIMRIHEERRRVENDLSLSIKQMALERQEARKRLAEDKQAIAQEKEIAQRNISMEKQKLINERALFEEEKKKISDQVLAAENTIQINVGGTVFETSKHTLTQQPQSLFQTLLSDTNPVPRDRHGNIFLDRDSDLFKCILQFLRYPQCRPAVRDAVESHSLCQETAYYGIKLFSHPLVFALGGCDHHGPVSSMEILDKTQDAWRPCHSLITRQKFFRYCIFFIFHTPARRYFASAIQLGSIYAFGGQNSEYKALCDVEVYDILRDTWFSGNSLLCFERESIVINVGPSLITPRRNTTSASLGNRFFTIGGFDGANRISTVEAYDPRMKNWCQVASLNTPRSSSCSAVVDDSIFAIGGTSGERLRSIEKYESRADRWVTLSGGLSEIRSAATSSTFLGAIYVFGGINQLNKILSSVESFDEWLYRHNLNIPLMESACASTPDSIILTGGHNETILNNSFFYQPELDEWREGKIFDIGLYMNQAPSYAGPSMLSPRYGHQVLVAQI
ncbi:kelch-like protein 1 isoform X2 [Hylaeus volcanicus]|uniref:kelch-like protein 1 isoform X2 n=1 Tax=Hylaeus volcanicus TaxID=313075 RepID=UPI0023B793FA|nr:kelch-like protein 1 isoform X2 [Hylaeus volcanicus]